MRTSSTPAPALRRRTLLGAAGGTLAAAFAGAPFLPAHAQAAGQPARLPPGPLRLLVGTPAGGTTDVIARLVALQLGELLGHAVVVENRPGVSGLIAAEAAAKAAPDGATLLMAPSQLSTYRALYKNTQFDPERDLAPLGLVATSPYVLVVHPSMPVNSFAELLAYARANPGKISYAGSTPGSAQHLGWELLKRSTKTQMQYVPYKGTGALMPDLLGGRLHAAIDNVAILTSHVKSGALRGIAVTSPNRSAMLPDLPTVASSGIPDFQAMGWFGVFTSARTPPAVVDHLREAMAKTLAAPAVRDKLTGMGAEPQSGGSDDLRALLQREVTTWTQVIRDSGITLD